jgi:hypothetical protein
MGNLIDGKLKIPPPRQNDNHVIGLIINRISMSLEIDSLLLLLLRCTLAKKEKKKELIECFIPSSSFLFSSSCLLIGAHAKESHGATAGKGG